MSEALQNWLSQELKKRGWSGQEFARQVGLTQPYVSRILTGRQPPSANFCNRVAIALDVPPETVLRLAGILPGEPASTGTHGPVTQELILLSENAPPDRRRFFLDIVRLADTLPPEQRQQLLDYAQFLSQKNR